MKYHKIVLGSIFFLLFTSVGCGQAQPDSVANFDEASVHFEQNATDGDVEVVFKVKSAEEGLATLRVVSPDGRTVMNYSAPDASTLGIRQFHFESPEPEDVDALKAAYPEGIYTFDGTTVSGTVLHDQAELSHALPPTATFGVPETEATALPLEGLVIVWTADRDLTACIVEIEQDMLDVNLTIKLPGDTRRFAPPKGFLLPDLEYKLSIGTVTEEGNISYVETAFSTAGESLPRIGEGAGN